MRWRPVACASSGFTPVPRSVRRHVRSVLTGAHMIARACSPTGTRCALQEKTIAQALQAARAMSTGHFGKWHLNGYKGPGRAEFLRTIPSPGAFGFDEWVSVTNFFDLDPLMSRAGQVRRVPRRLFRDRRRRGGEVL